MDDFFELLGSCAHKSCENKQLNRVWVWNEAKLSTPQCKSNRRVHKANRVILSYRTKSEIEERKDSQHEEPSSNLASRAQERPTRDQGKPSQEIRWFRFVGFQVYGHDQLFLLSRFNTSAAAFDLNDVQCISLEQSNRLKHEGLSSSLGRVEVNGRVESKRLLVN